MENPSACLAWALALGAGCWAVIVWLAALAARMVAGL